MLPFNCYLTPGTDSRLFLPFAGCPCDARALSGGRENVRLVLPLVLSLLSYSYASCKCSVQVFGEEGNVHKEFLCTSLPRKAPGSLDLIFGGSSSRCVSCNSRRRCNRHIFTYIFVFVSPPGTHALLFSLLQAYDFHEDPCLSVVISRLQPEA